MKKRLACPIAMAVALLVLLGACGPRELVPPDRATETAAAAEATAQAARTAGPRETAAAARETQAAERVAAATQQADAEILLAARAWPLTASDDFGQDYGAWYTGEENGAPGDLERSISEGRYRWEAAAKERFGSWTTPEHDNTPDFYLSARMRLDSGPPESEMGVVFRVDEAGSLFYVFEINNRGQFAFCRYGRDGCEVLIDWQDSPAVFPGEENRLEVVAQGDRFILAANGQPVAELQDDQLQDGQAGLLIGLPGGEEGVWEFDDFELRSPAAP